MRPILKPGETLDQSLVRSVGWNAAASWTIQIVSWLISLEVARLLTPADFGIAALTVLLMPHLGVFMGLGIPRAVVALPPMSDDQLAQLTAVNLIMGGLCFALGLAFAKPFAAFFRTPPLATVFAVGCGGFLLGAATAVPGALIAKARRFRFLSVMGISLTVVNLAVTLGMAWLHYGYWSLLTGSWVAQVIQTVVILYVQPCKLAWPRFNSIREPLRFGWHLSVSTLALNSYEQLDNFVAGRMLGQSALGLYGNAWQLANVPMEKVASLVTTVVPAYLATVRSDAAALRRYLGGLTEVVALAAFPACIGLGLVVRDFVPLVLGHKWDGMVPPAQVLVCYAAFRSIAALLPKVITAVGNARYVMWNDLFALIVLPTAFYVGSYRGIVGIAWGWVVAYPIVVLPLYRKAFQIVGMKTRDYLRCLLPALTGTVAMIPAVEWVKYRLPASPSLWLRLMVEVAVGALVYVGAVFLFHRRRVLVLIQLAKHLLPGKYRGTEALNS
jgi:teichuronic acid exporter